VSHGPPFLPPELTGLEKRCQCGAVVQPDLWTPLKEPQPEPPVYPYGTHGERGAWFRVPVANCGNCGEQLLFPIDYKALEYELFLFGDEAERTFKGYDLHSYSLVGGTSGPRDHMRQTLRKLKAEWVPWREPDSWRIHATEMMSGQKRLRHPVYKHMKKDSVLELFRQCAAILKSIDEYKWASHITALYRVPSTRKERKQHWKHAKALAHNALLSDMIHRATSQRLRPVFTLDATKPIKHYPHIERWSYESFRNSQYYLAHAFLTHANEIQPPKFVEPGSDPCLELADVHAYFAARTIEKRAKGHEAEIALPEFGKIRYMAIVNENRFEYHVGEDIPSTFYPSS